MPVKVERYETKVFLAGAGNRNIREYEFRSVSRYRRVAIKVEGY
jgi:hypothetical protein